MIRHLWDPNEEVELLTTPSPLTSLLSFFLFIFYYFLLSIYHIFVSHFFNLSYVHFISSFQVSLCDTLHDLFFYASEIVSAANPLTTELLAIRNSCRLAPTYGWHIAIVESDCKVAISSASS